MNRKQESVTFGLAGLLFGVLIGYLTAYQVHAPRVRAAQVNRPPAASGMPAGSPQGTPAGEDHMEQIGSHIRHLEEEAAADPANPRPLMELGNMYLQVFKYEEAAGYLERALAIDSDDLGTRTNLGICYVQLERVEEALEMFRGSVEIDPDHWESWMYLGVIALSRNHDVETAERAFQEVERLQPGLPDLEGLRRELEKIRAQHASGS